MMVKHSSLLSRARFVGASASLLAGMVLLGSPTPARAVQPDAPLQITATQGMFPAFDPNITDYVVGPTSATSVNISVNAPRNVKVSIDGQPFRKQAFTTQVTNLSAGQRFSFVVNDTTGSKTYNVRSLPADFPTWTTQRSGTPQAEFYVFSPSLLFTTKTYVIVADNYGVPVWWYHTYYLPIDAKILSNGNISWEAFVPNSSAEVHTFDGLLQQTVTPANGDGGGLDPHELLRLANGNNVILVNTNRTGVDLSAFGGSSTATVIDQTIEEVAPDGTLVWSWSAMDHLPISATVARWRAQFLVAANPTDPYHVNSIEADGDGYVVSFRHHDAVYRIDKATGAITWKLGGTTTSESLSFVGDSYGNFGGQHDARILPDGTLTVHDNGTNLVRSPRAVRYSLNLTNRTATLMEQVTDSAAARSPFIGSARKLPGGNWVTAWGGNRFVTEQNTDGTVVLRLTFTDTVFTYRADPVLPGILNRTDLRNGMDAQFPR